MATSSSKKAPSLLRKRPAEVELMASGAGNSSQVRVFVRVRPLTAKEQAAGSAAVLDVTNGCVVQLSERRFTYDAAFDAETTQAELYEKLAPTLLQSFLDGFNATIMAYGQTGSGKTYTMGSEAHTELEITPNTGLIPRVLRDLFEQLPEDDCHLETSFLEVYGEDVHDLLDSSRATLPLREDSGGGIVCVGLTTRTVKSAAEAVKVLHEGTLNRTTAATLMNLTSSRSHAVFTVTLKRQSLSSKFTFVDLAGSERMKKTGAEGERAREGIEINKGLLALGNVINALADDERLQIAGRKIHVPYRQSKLTRFLQDALGGNSQTVFLACVSCADINVSETLSTLHYANRARNIQNAPTRNIDPTLERMHQSNAYLAVLEAEVIRLKFDPNSFASSPTGKMSDELSKEDGASEYLLKLQLLAQQMAKTNTSVQPVFPSEPPSLPLHSSIGNELSLAPPLDNNQSLLGNFDSALLDEVNPDEELAILDQLLELQQQDHDYDREQKKDHEELKQVEGELVEKEQLLLQLRDSLKVYHNMKAKYESLIVEVQNLELEKMALAEQLEKASSDPTLGCSRAIRKEMEMVERSLVRARSETRKHREMYKRAEQEAQKCRTLELQVKELKQGRANLIKKQREAALRHRELTEVKTREIMTLKRKDRNAERKMSKLEHEIQIQKRNLDSRQAYCKKLMEQKKQAEAHLMKLLSMRQHTLKERAKRVVCKHQIPESTEVISSFQEQHSFAPNNEEVVSITYLLDKAVQQSVVCAELKEQYESRVVTYSDLMRAMVDAVKRLEEANTDDKQELEHAIRELEIKIELSGTDLDKIRDRLSQIENDGGNDISGSLHLLIKDKAASVLRTVLLGTIDKLLEAEIHRKQLRNLLIRKDQVVKSFEAEVDSLNNDIAGLKRELMRHHSNENVFESQERDFLSVVRDNVALKLELEQSQQEQILLKLFSDDLASDYERVAGSLEATKEKLAFATVAYSQLPGAKPPDDFLTEIQSLWDDLGITPTDRSKLCSQIENCLEVTCSNLLQDAQERKNLTIELIADIRQEIYAMNSALKLKHDDVVLSSSQSLLVQLKELQGYHSRLKPLLENATNRRNAIASKASDLVHSLGISRDSLGPRLITLLDSGSSVSFGSGETNVLQKQDLSDDFLSSCENAVYDLQLRKSKILTVNSGYRDEVLSLVTEMNLKETDVLALVVHSIEQRLRSIPEWWDNEAANVVVRSVTTVGGVVRSSLSFSQHLKVIHESLSSISMARRHLSSKLRDMIERTQQILLTTVDGEFEANAEYSNFHEALFRLPPLSKECIQSCFAEIEALSVGVDVMTQSEIEALTVVWEALNISSAKRGKFWGAIDHDLRQMDAKAGGPFDDVVAFSTVDGEEWILSAVKEGTKSFKELESRLFKLEKIHNTVEELRSRQDAKSKIISLDSEVRILSAKLKEFEDQKCIKLRLTTKKCTSSTLLKEERFRKQMQLKFTAKLEQLSVLLQAWKENENTPFDQDLLSVTVRMLLKNSDRNEFMHLRTVQYKGSAKRQVSTSEGAPPTKRLKVPKRDTIAQAPTQANVPTSKENNISVREDVTQKNCDGIRKGKARSPFQPTRSSGNVRPRVLVETKKLVLDPFGDILDQALSPQVLTENKEIQGAAHDDTDKRSYNT